VSARYGSGVGLISIGIALATAPARTRTASRLQRHVDALLAGLDDILVDAHEELFELVVRADAELDQAAGRAGSVRPADPRLELARRRAVRRRRVRHDVHARERDARVVLHEERASVDLAGCCQREGREEREASRVAAP
jgi:hypothetical protein